MFRRYWILLLLLTMATFFATTQTVLLSGTSPAPIIYPNNGSTVWINGSITVTKNNSSIGPITVDLSPASDTRKNNWLQIGTVSDTTRTLTTTQVYLTPTVTQSIFRLWDATNSDNTREIHVFEHDFGTSAVGTSITVPYYATIAASGLSAGTYERSLEFRVRAEAYVGNKDDANTSPVGTPLVIKLRFVVNPIATISFLSGISGSSALTQLAFPEVTTTTRSDFRLSIASNFRYAISVASIYNHGNYLYHSSDNHISPPSIAPIPYTLRLVVGGIESTYSIASGSALVASSERPTGAGTREYAAAIIIGDISEYTAGSYSDSLTFTVAAQ